MGTTVGSQSRKAGALGGRATEDKGSQESGGMRTKRHLWEHSREKGLLRADGAPKTVILREPSRTGGTWMECGRREVQTLTKQLLLHEAYPGDP